MFAEHCVRRGWPASPTSMLALLMLVLAGLCQAAWAEPVDEVRARLKQWIEFHNAHDANSLAQLYDQNARLFSTAGTDKPLDGKEAIRAYFAQIFKMEPSSVAIDHNDAVQLFSEVAIETGFYHLDSRDSRGSEQRTMARYTFVFVKKEGSWTIVHQHSSRVPQPMAAPAKAG